MKNNKFLKSALVGMSSLMIGLSGLNLYKFAYPKYQNYNERQKVEIVRQGDIVFSDKDLVTYDLTICSVVVFDYGNYAFMGHALPINFKISDKRYKLKTEGKIIDGTKIENRRMEGVSDIVDCLVEESLTNGFNPKDAAVYISASWPELQDKITEDLKKAGITNIIESKSRANSEIEARTKRICAVRYSPSNNTLEVKDMNGSDRIKDIRRADHPEDYL